MLSWQPFLVRSRLKTRINAAQCRHHNRYHNILKVLSESIVPKLYQNDSKRTKTCSLEICGMLFAALRHCSSLFIRRWMRQRLKAALTMVHTCLLHVLVLISLQVAEQFQLRNFAARVKLWQRFGWSDTATEKELPFFFFCRCTLHKTRQDLQLWTFWHLNAFVHKPEVHAFAESWSGVRVAGLWNVPHTVPLDGGCSLNQCFCRLSHQVTKHSLSASIFPVFFSRCCSLREDKKNVELSWCLRANLRHNLKPNPPQLILFVL